MVLPFKGNSLIINTSFVQQLHENKDSVGKHLVVCEVVFAACVCYSFSKAVRQISTNQLIIHAFRTGNQPDVCRLH